MDFAHIPMYAVLVVKLAYIRAYRFKIHVYNFSHVFRDGQGNIKGKKWSMGSKESTAGQGKAIQCVIHLEC